MNVVKLSFQGSLITNIDIANGFVASPFPFPLLSPSLYTLITSVTVGIICLVHGRQLIFVNEKRNITSRRGKGR
jgi:hypothetical protein